MSRSRSDAAFEPTIPLKEHIEKIQAERDRLNERWSDKLEAERDLRYQQRWEAQGKAIETGSIAAEKAINAALAAQEKAAERDREANLKSFRDSNEWRTTYGDRDRLQVPRLEYSAGIANLSEKIDDLGKSRDRGDGRSASGTASWGYLIAAVGIATGIAGLALALLR